MAISAVESTKKYYRKISLYIWVFVFTFLSIIILFPEIIDIFIPGASDKLFSTPTVYLIFFLFFIDIIELLTTIRKKLFQLKKQIIFENQTKSLSEVLNVIQNNKIDQAYMLEVSCSTANPILRALLDNNCTKINLLIQHPEYTTDSEQKKRIENVISNEKILWLNTPNLNIRLYKFESSIRGRLFNNQWLNFGWFTPKYKFKYLNEKKMNIDGNLIGHLNPMLFVEKGNVEGKILIDHFKKVFDSLYSKQYSISIEEYFMKKK